MGHFAKTFDAECLVGAKNRLELVTGEFMGVTGNKTAEDKKWTKQ